MLVLVTLSGWGGQPERVRRVNGPTIKMPGQIAGKVIHVDDGDTLVMLDTDGFKRIIRLSDIDAPEIGHGTSRPGQPYSAKATSYLKELTLGQAALATCFDIDGRKRDDGTVRERYVCRVQVDGVNANMAMIDAGLAMAYRANRRYIRDVSTLPREDAARSARQGLWSQAHPIPPWRWRRSCWGFGDCEQP